MVRLLAQAMGAQLDELREKTERFVAREPLQVPMARVEAGQVSAIRFEVAGMVGGRVLIVAEHVTRLRRDQAPHWPQPPEGRPSVHRVEIQGSPSLTLDLALGAGPGGRAGLLATAMLAVNAVPAVCAAPPGLVTVLELPLAPRPGLLRPAPAPRTRPPPPLAKGRRTKDS